MHLYMYMYTYIPMYVHSQRDREKDGRRTDGQTDRFIYIDMDMYM